MNSSKYLKTPVAPSETLIKRDCGFMDRQDGIPYLNLDSEVVIQRVLN
jgi:hypothetical protein